MADSEQRLEKYEDPALRRQQWKWTFVASMANYIDAGSIIAGSIGLAMWAKQFHMGNPLIGFLGAFSSNAISAGVGALIGGRLCDLYGRKKIYAWDLLVYMFGILWIIFASNAWMLIVGYMIIGLAVGADIPASWTLIVELAPSGSRGRMSGLAQVLWSVGPVIVFVLGFAFANLGLLGIRLIFVHLLILAFITWILRRGVIESPRWKALMEQKAAAPDGGTDTSSPPARPGTGFRSDLRELLRPTYVKAWVFLILMYGLWNLAAGTQGFFLPFILRTVGAQSQAATVGVIGVGFLLCIVGVYFVFMPFSDRVNRRKMLGVSTILQVVGLALFAFLPLTMGSALGEQILFGVSVGFGQQPLFQLWSGELFPTQLRSTAQGFAFAVVRIVTGIWSFFVPLLVMSGFQRLALIMLLMVGVSGIIGVVFGEPTQ